LSCTGLTIPSACTRNDTCGSNQQCGVLKVSDGTYNTGCISTTKCSDIGQQVIGRRAIGNGQTQICLRCCNTNNCNNVGCGSEEEECKKYLGKGYFYDSVTQMCAKVVKSDTSLNHSEADTDCKQDGASLITVNNENKQYFLLSWIFTHFKNADFWIGLQKNTSDGYKFHWEHREPVVYDNWGHTYNKQPSDKRTGTEDCVYLDADDNYLWHDGNCNAPKSGFICEIWNISNNDLATYCRKKVFQGYLYDFTTNMCFKLMDSKTEAFTHEEALSACVDGEPGATLAILDSEQRTDLIRRWIFSNQANTTSFWIGLSDVTNTSTFIWPNGSSLTGYENWGGPDVTHVKDNQPDHRHNNEDCIYMARDFGYKWFDVNCIEPKNGFICQHFSTQNIPGGGCFNKLAQGYFYDVHTQLCVKVYTNGTWERDEAQAICQSQGDGLLEIKNDDQNTYIEYLMRSLGHHRKTDFWLGAKYDPRDRQFHWHSSNSRLTYDRWFKNTEAPKNCVVLDHTDQYMWAPRECSYRAQGFICQLDSQALGRLSG